MIPPKDDLKRFSFASIIPEGDNYSHMVDGRLIALDFGMVATQKDRKITGSGLRDTSEREFAASRYSETSLPGKGNAHIKLLTFQDAIDLIEVFPKNMPREKRDQFKEILRRGRDGDKTLFLDPVNPVHAQPGAAAPPPPVGPDANAVNNEGGNAMPPAVSAENIRMLAEMSKVLVQCKQDTGECIECLNEVVQVYGKVNAEKREANSIAEANIKIVHDAGIEEAAKIKRIANAQAEADKRKNEAEREVAAIAAENIKCIADAQAEADKRKNEAEREAAAIAAAKLKIERESYELSELKRKHAREDREEENKKKQKTAAADFSEEVEEEEEEEIISVRDVLNKHPEIHRGFSKEVENELVKRAGAECAYQYRKIFKVLLVPTVHRWGYNVAAYKPEHTDLFIVKALKKVAEKLRASAARNSANGMAPLDTYWGAK
jgi:hypothetical protein